MRLSIADAVGLVHDAAWSGRVRPVGPVPRVDPTLRATYCARIHQPPPPRWQQEPDPFWGPPKVAPSEAAEAAPPGLVGGAESDRRDVPPRRYGFRGLTPKGAQRLRAGASLLEEDRRCCGFWTINLPDCAILALLDRDGWSTFQSAVRRLLTRRLRERGLAGEVVGVVEFCPERSARCFQQIPHLHVLFRGKPHRWAPWVLSTHDLDRIVLDALWEQGVIPLEPLRGCKGEGVRKSVRRYLAKYLTKAPRQTATVGTSWCWGDPRLCPRQWWFCSRPLKERIDRATMDLPAEFLAFLLERRIDNREGQLYQAWCVEGLPRGAPVIWAITWRSPWALFLTLEAWERALYCGERRSAPA